MLLPFGLPLRPPFCMGDGGPPTHEYIYMADEYNERLIIGATDQRADRSLFGIIFSTEHLNICQGQGGPPQVVGRQVFSGSAF